MKTKTLYTLLKENKYKTYNKHSLEKIEKVTKEYLNSKDAFWFGELAKLVRSYNKIKMVSAQQNSFELGNIYSILKEFYRLNKEDKLEINCPENIVDEENFGEIREKARKFYEFSLGQNRNTKSVLKNITLENEGLSEVSFWDGRASGIPAQRGDSKNLLGRIYFNLATKNLIAYKNPKEAIEFFEKETGINISNPKEYKKLVF